MLRGVRDRLELRSGEAGREEQPVTPAAARHTARARQSDREPRQPPHSPLPVHSQGQSQGRLAERRNSN